MFGGCRSFRLNEYRGGFGRGRSVRVVERFSIVHARGWDCNWDVTAFLSSHCLAVGPDTNTLSMELYSWKTDALQIRFH